MKAKPSASGIDIELLEKVTTRLSSMTHPLRLAILELLMEEGTLSVTSIYKKLKIEQAVCSQHLRILKECGFVLAKRDGKKIFYSVKPKSLKNIADCINRCSG